MVRYLGLFAIKQLNVLVTSVSDPYSLNPDPVKNLNPNPETPESGSGFKPFSNTAWN